MPLLYSKVVGGTPVRPGGMQYMTSIRIKDGHHLCGGALISTIHILTAASCIYKFVPIRFPKYGGIYATLGSITLSHGIRHSIKHLDIEDSYVPGPCAHINDIAVITVSVLCN